MFFDTFGAYPDLFLKNFQIASGWISVKSKTIQFIFIRA